MTSGEDEHIREKILHLLHPCMSCEELIDEGTLSFSEAFAVDPENCPGSGDLARILSYLIPFAPTANFPAGVQYIIQPVPVSRYLDLWTTIFGISARHFHPGLGDLLFPTTIIITLQNGLGQDETFWVANYRAKGTAEAQGERKL